MATFWKKDKTVQAYKVADLVMMSITSWSCLPESVLDAYKKDEFTFHRGFMLFGDGTQKANPEDYIVESNGSLRIVRERYFQKHFTPVTHEHQEN